MLVAAFHAQAAPIALTCCRRPWMRTQRAPAAPVYRTRRPVALPSSLSSDVIAFKTRRRKAGYQLSSSLLIGHPPSSKSPMTDGAAT